MSDYVICAAMPEEADALRSALESGADRSFEALSGVIPVWKLAHGNNTYYVAQSGIGEVNASLSLSYVLASHCPSPTSVISTGTCGAIAAKTDIGHIIVGQQYYYSNVDATAFGYALGQIPQMPTHYGSDSAAVDNAIQRLSQHFSVDAGDIATGDTFVDDTALREILTRFPDIIAVDMETTALAQVCYRYDLDFLMIRCVSDLCLNDEGSRFNGEKFSASDRAGQAVATYLLN